MKVYLCSRVQRREEMKVHRESLIAAGHECTSRWLDTDDNIDAISGALMDMEDLSRSDAVIAFTDDPGVGYTTGGRWVEFGFAWASNLQVCIVGPMENIFCHLPNVKRAETLALAIQHLT